MGHTNCVVCDQCGKHEGPRMYDRTSVLRGAWNTALPKGWVIVVSEDARIVANATYCSLACANRAAREAPCSD